MEIDIDIDGELPVEMVQAILWEQPRLAETEVRGEGKIPPKSLHSPDQGAHRAKLEELSPKRRQRRQG